MPSPQVCHVAGCKYLATQLCADCLRPICGEHAWWNQRAQPDPDAYEWRCPVCYSKFMDRRYAKMLEELQAARAELAKARLEVEAMAREAGLCIPASSSDASTTQ